jgi:hypothetical protein
MPDEKKAPRGEQSPPRPGDVPDRKTAEEDDDDLVDTMSEDSFPASDPPSHARRRAARARPPSSGKS